MMVFFKAVHQRVNADGHRQNDHQYFKINVINDVETQYGQACYNQWQQCTMDGTGYGCSNP
jgi:hypothetical protein